MGWKTLKSLAAIVSSPVLFVRVGFSSHLKFLHCGFRRAWGGRGLLGILTRITVSRPLFTADTGVDLTVHCTNFFASLLLASGCLSVFFLGDAGWSSFQSGRVGANSPRPRVFQMPLIPLSYREDYGLEQNLKVSLHCL